MKGKTNATPAVLTANSKHAKRSAEAQHGTLSRPDHARSAMSQPKGKKRHAQKGHAKGTRFQASESVSKCIKAATKVKTNGRNGAEHRGLEPASPKISESPRSVVADREKNSPLAQSQMATSSNGESISAKHPSSLPSISGPLKSEETEGELEISPSYAAKLARTFGTSNLNLCIELLLQVTRASPKEPHDPDGKYVLAALDGISPRDTVEAMLATEMVVVHNHAMGYLRRAALPGLPLEVAERCVNLATKLNRTYVAQMEALDRRRGKGEQKMNVEQVHIHDGGQGIVGPFSHQGSLDASAEDHGKANGKSH
jgi:hypothetical protein